MWIVAEIALLGQLDSPGVATYPSGGVGRMDIGQQVDVRHDIDGRAAVEEKPVSWKAILLEDEFFGSTYIERRLGVAADGVVISISRPTYFLFQCMVIIIVILVARLDGGWSATATTATTAATTTGLSLTSTSTAAASTTSSPISLVLVKGHSTSVMFVR